MKLFQRNCDDKYALNNEKYQKVTKEMIFSENTEELKQTAKIIQERMEMIEEKQGTNTDY